jgi:hypothetical protein
MFTGSGNRRRCASCRRAAEASVRLANDPAGEVVPWDDPAGQVRQVAERHRIATDYLAGIPRVDGDCLISSDDHVHKHSPAKLERVCRVAVVNRIRTLVLAGDFVDFEELSSHRRSAGKVVSAGQSIGAAAAVLNALAAVFDRIVWIRGNHEDRLMRLIEAAVATRSPAQALLLDLEFDELEALDFRARYQMLLERWLAKYAPEAAPKVEVSAHAVARIAGPSGLPEWAVLHQKNGSRRPPYEGLNFWQKLGCPVLMTHTHLFGMTLAPNGLHPIVQIGCGTEERNQHYPGLAPTGYPNWVLGFAMIRNGRLSLFPDNPYLTDWEDLQRAYATSRRTA